MEGIIEITTLAEIKGRIEETQYTGRSVETKLLLLKTKKLAHIFLIYDPSDKEHERVYYLKESHEAFERMSAQQIVDQIGDKYYETLYWQIYDEIVEDMEILNQ
jgi:hypothetical protein